MVWRGKMMGMSVCAGVGPASCSEFVRGSGVGRRAGRVGGAGSSRSSTTALLTREQKAKRIEEGKELLKNSAVVAAFDYKGLSVKQMQGVRRSLPEGTTCRVYKNRVMAEAIKDTPYADLSSVLNSQSCYLFVPEDSIAKTFKGFKKAMKANGRDGKTEPLFTGGIMDEKMLTPGDIDRLEELPTKEELMGKIASMLYSIPRSLAVGVKQVPTKLAVGVNEVSKQKE